MPSSSLGNKVPFSILFPNYPLFHVPPRVFGYICFVHDLSPGLDKLFACAIKCFLGSKRVWCYSHATTKNTNTNPSTSRNGVVLDLKRKPSWLVNSVANSWVQPSSRRVYQVCSTSKFASESICTS